MSNELKILARDVGTWDAEILVRPGPGMPLLPTKGEATNRLIADGRWLLIDFKNDNGFEGHGVYGFDPAIGKYVSTWVDTTRTFLAVGQGSYDPETRTMAYVTQATMADGTILIWREETTAVDDDTRRFRQVFLTQEGEAESMTAIYKRRVSS